LGEGYRDTTLAGLDKAISPNPAFADATGASLHRNLEGRLYRVSAGEKGFQLSLITPFEVGV
jgi:hypothetical protein